MISELTRFRVFEQTDAVTHFISSFDCLNADSLKEGKRIYRNILETYINTCV